MVELLMLVYLKNVKSLIPEGEGRHVLAPLPTQHYAKIWIDIYSSNSDRSLNFYVNVFFFQEINSWWITVDVRVHLWFVHHFEREKRRIWILRLGSRSGSLTIAVIRIATKIIYFCENKDVVSKIRNIAIWNLNHL